MKDYKNPDVLYNMYHERGMSQREIAEELDVSCGTIFNWMKHHNIESRTPTNDKYGSHYFDNDYSRYSITQDGETYGVLIHRLAAVSWFGLDAVVGKEVHHKSGWKFDNREENLECLTASEHATLHNRNS